MTKQHIETAVEKRVTGMAEYIEREAAIEAVKHAWAKGLEPSQYLEIISAADVAPVRHGRWIKENSRKKSYLWICSNCRKIAYFCSGDGKCAYQYCPNCGADMSKEDEDE